MALPILPDGMELVKKFAQEHGGHTKEHDEFYRIAGVTRERIWIQRSPPGSGAPDLEIANIETGDLAKAFKEIATSNHPWAVRFRDYAKKAHGVDFAGPSSITQREHSGLAGGEATFEYYRCHKFDVG